MLLAAAALSQAVLARDSRLPAVPTAHTAYTGPTSSLPPPPAAPMLSTAATEPEITEQSPVSCIF